MKKNVFSFILLLLFFASCTTLLNTGIEKLKVAAVCCMDFDDFEFEKLNIRDSKRFDIHENSKAFSFHTGKSFFKAFELPEYSSPYSITIKSYALGGSIHSSYVYSPAIIILDENYQTSRTISHGIFRFMKTDFGESIPRITGIQGLLKGTVHFAKENLSERYIIILTTDHLLSRKTLTLHRVVRQSISSGVIYVAHKRTIREVFIPHSAVGKLNIDVHKYRGFHK